MKNLLLLSVLSTLFISCTSESIENVSSGEQTYQEEKKLRQTQKFKSINPENTANLYDIAGQVHNAILDAYLTGNHSCNTIEAISQKVDSISAANFDFLNLESNLPINFGEIQQIVDDPQTQLEQVITNSSMSNSAKTCLSDFMSSVSVWELNEYETLHDSIISFETIVVGNPEFSTEDQRIILTTSSIVRYAQYYSKKRKDKDWETSVGNRAGAVKGAIGNCSTAINASIVTGLAIHSLQIP